MLVIERQRGQRIRIETPEGERFSLRPTTFYPRAGDSPAAVEVELTNESRPASPASYRLTLEQALIVRTTSGRRVSARVTMLTKSRCGPWRLRLGFDAERVVRIYREEICPLVGVGSTDAPGPA